MKRKPLVSIIVPIYNVEGYVGKALTSLENQEFMDYEVIMIDDNSDDASYDIAKQFAKKDKRFSLIRNEKNEGLAQTRNIGMKYAKGEWLYFFDSDDILPQNLFSLLKRYLEKHFDMILFNSFTFSSGEKLPKTVHLKSSAKLSKREAIDGFINNEIEMTAWSYITRRSLIVSNNIKFSKGRLFEDGNFLMSLLCTAGQMCKVTLSPGGYFYRKLRKGSIMFKVNKHRSLRQLKDSIFISKDIMNSLEKASQTNRSLVKYYVLSTFLRLGFEYSEVIINNDKLRLSLVELINEKKNQYDYKFSEHDKLKFMILKNRLTYHLYCFLKNIK
ncbi:glycosyltransferase family 2 protein [Limosilactobacillus pontis]|uniref:glycosyltransferase family 2 protein n=1 Tax=Limosilactobacillus pontis TaxID=35787 RepID=UPI00241D5F57|nr:glycosyltransferase family 2 protein [Limosilactobacillus pontis]